MGNALENNHRNKQTRLKKEVDNKMSFHSPLKFAVVADDNTGATDAAGMLTERGVTTLLILNKNYLLPDRLPKGFGAYIYSTATRSLPRETAYRETAFAVEQFKASGTEKIQIKYSSTFDSTPRGNIGPSLDAALDVLQLKATTVSPALPINGRTTYFGYHFVNGSLISESPLRYHPLNPMTEPSLVRWLSKQTKRQVGLAPLNVIRRGEKELASYLKKLIDEGVSYIVTDTIEQRDLKVIAKSTRDWRLISGGSGITAEIPELMFGLTQRELSGYFTERLTRINALRPKIIIAAGSCTPATIEQNEYAISRMGLKGFKLDAKAVIENRIDFKAEAKQILNNSVKAPGILIYTSATPKEVSKNKELGASMGLSPEETGRKIVEGLARLAGELMELERFGKLCISGGETSGILCKHLGIDILEVGLPIEPGVPYCLTSPLAPGEEEKLVVLKSGNFGSEDFYERVKEL